MTIYQGMTGNASRARGEAEGDRERVRTLSRRIHFLSDAIHKV